MAAGIVTPALLPAEVRQRCGERRSQQLGAFIDALVATVVTTGRIGMDEQTAEVLAAFRACNYEHVYLREASVAQGRAVVAVLRALVEHYADRPNAIPDVAASGGAAGRRARRGPGRRHLRGRHDRPVRLPPGRRRARVGPGQAPRRGGRLVLSRRRRRAGPRAVSTLADSRPARGRHDDEERT